MADTSIEWTNATWNPVAGCSIVSAGCTNCYAMRLAARLEAMGVEKYDKLTRKSGSRRIWTGRVHLDESSLNIPTKWRKPRRIFVNSMSDLFHESVPTDFIARVWHVMASNQHHTFQILTKRPDRMALVIKSTSLPFLPNVWLGTSVEDSIVLERIDHLRSIKATVRFVSFEPLIGSVAHANLDGVAWVIVGGESGPNARPMQVEWVDEIEAACRESGAAFFFKQWGGVQKKKAGRTYRDRLWDELPELRM